MGMLVCRRVMFVSVILLLIFIFLNQTYNNDIRDIIMRRSCSSRMLSEVLLARLVPSLSKNLIVHSAYVDQRPINGYSNATILIAHINKTILDSGWILGCGLGNTLSCILYAHSVLVNNTRGLRYRVVYQSVLIFCYDLPAIDGGNAFVIYKTSETSSVSFIAYSKSPVYHPVPKPSSSGDNITITVCSRVNSTSVSWLREFVQHQKVLGVDHVDFSVLDIFIQDGGYDEVVMNDSVIKDALLEGFIDFRVWSKLYMIRGEARFNSEVLRKLDCAYRFLGTYDYVMQLDTEDFFIPKTQNVSLKKLINEHCSKESNRVCRLDHIFYSPDCWLDEDMRTDGNVTAHLLYERTEHLSCKSIYSKKAMLDNSFHNEHCKEFVSPGFDVVSIPQSVAYIANVKGGMDQEFPRKLCQLDKMYS